MGSVISAGTIHDLRRVKVLGTGPLWNPCSDMLTLVISNSMGPWKKFESTVVRLKRSYENTGSVVCLTTKGRQLERNFEELKPASHVPILGTISNIFDVFVAVFFSSVILLLHFRYFRSSSWVELRLTRIFSMVPTNSREGSKHKFPIGMEFENWTSSVHLL
jgi:hypothetical protein